MKINVHSLFRDSLLIVLIPCFFLLIPFPSRLQYPVIYNGTFRFEMRDRPLCLSWGRAKDPVSSEPEAEADVTQGRKAQLQGRMIIRPQFVEGVMEMTNPGVIFWAVFLCCAFLFFTPLVLAAARADMEKVQIAKVIDDSIGWFKNKDFELLFQIFADSPDLLLYQPTSEATIKGIEAFRNYSIRWKNPEVVYDRHEVRELRIDLAKHKDVAWFSALLDDCGKTGNRSFCWKDTRWTGVLQKHQGKWRIIQMHFSLAADKVQAAAKVQCEAEKK